VLLPLWPIEPLLLAAGLWLSAAVDGGPWLSDGAVVPLAPCELPALAVPAPPVADESDGLPAAPVEAALLLLEPGSLLAVRVSLLRCAQAPSPIRLVAASAIPR
jgi:hypothetical protein